MTCFFADFIGETTQRHQTRHLAVKRNKPKRQKSRELISHFKEVKHHYIIFQGRQSLQTIVSD